MAKARSWSSLSDRQKKRYVGAARTGSLTGIPIEGTPRQITVATKRYYESGGSLEGGRGRHQPPGAAPRRAYLQEVTGNGDNRSADVLKAWREGPTVPKWIPTNRVVMFDDTAAALSQIGIHPRNWQSVDIRRSPDGTNFIMTVKSKRGATRIVNLPDRDSVSQVAALMRNREGQGRSRQEITDLYSEWEQRTGRPWSIDVTIQDTDPKTRPRSKTVTPAPTNTKALPPTRKKAKK